MQAEDYSPGGYRFIPAGFPFSSGVAAMPGYRIERRRFHASVPLAEGFRRIAAVLRSAGRPATAFCACELRSPAPFSEGGFKSFNQAYVATLVDWGLFDGARNPVARSNVCPAIDPPSEPSFHAFCFTVPDAAAAPSFVISGGAEAAEGEGSYHDRIIRRGDTSPGAIREKAAFVLAQMERRMETLGFGWRNTTTTQVYTVHDLHPFLAEEIVQRGAAPAGLTWHFCRPPVVGLDYEMDCRNVPTEYVLE